MMIPAEWGLWSATTPVVACKVEDFALQTRLETVQMGASETLNGETTFFLCAKNKKKSDHERCSLAPAFLLGTMCADEQMGTDILAGPQTALPAYSTAIGISFPFASSVFGSVTVNTPSLKIAFTLFASTVFGSANDRVKFPQHRSTR